MMKQTFKRGFTLIELLVVIAIIGILASVVLASLSTARDKGTDAAIKSALTSARAQVELFYDRTKTYDGVCLAAQSEQGVSAIILNAAQKLLASNTVAVDSAWTYSASGAGNDTVCNDSGLGWLAIVSLKSPSTANAGWCVDSSGQAKEYAGAGIAAGTVVCP
jgi:prepilin-type N-terminal cleavage/methylation domain-containing protein